MKLTEVLLKYLAKNLLAGELLLWLKPDHETIIYCQYDVRVNDAVGGTSAQ